jgi:hypothetical protein
VATMVASIANRKITSMTPVTAMLRLLEETPVDAAVSFTVARL